MRHYYFVTSDWLILNMDKHYSHYEDLHKLMSSKVYGEYIDSMKNSKAKMNKRLNIFNEFVMGDEAMMSASAMCQNFIDHMDTAFEKWTPRKRYTIFEV